VQHVEMIASGSDNRFDLRACPGTGYGHRARRRFMIMIMDHWTKAAWCSGRRS
jgi:hypothetical protein